MADEIISRDQNFVTVLAGITDDVTQEIRMFRVDPATNRLLVSAAGLSSGTVTSFSFTNANGVSGVVTNPTTTPDLTISLGAITPTSVNGLTITSSTGTLTITNGKTLTILKSMSFTAADDTGVYTLPTGTKTLVATDVTTLSSLASVGTITSGTWNATTIALIHGGTGLTAISANSIWAANSANALVEITVTAGQSVRLNGAGNAWEAFTPSAAVPSTITVANEATDTSCFIAFFTAATGDLGPKTNVNMTFNSNTGVVTFASSVLTTTDINGGTIDGTVIGGSSAAAITATTITGTVITGNSFVPNSSTIPTDGMYLPAASTLGWAVGSAAEMQLTSTALSPAADGGSSLGTTALGWQNLFANTGFVINIENGNWVATHTSAVLTVGTGDLRVTNAGTDNASVVTIAGTQTLTNKTLTSPAINTSTLGGHQTMLENAAFLMDPVLSADGKYNGWVRGGTAGTTLAFGDLIYLDPTDSRWELADANSAAGADGDSRGVLGICVLAAAADGDATTILLWGIVRADTAFPTFTVNNPIYVSETAGDVTGTQPTTTDVVIRIVGVGLTADELFFNPDQSWITHT